MPENCAAVLLSRVPRRHALREHRFHSKAITHTRRLPRGYSFLPPLGFAVVHAGAP